MNLKTYKKTGALLMGLVLTATCGFAQTTSVKNEIKAIDSGKNLVKLNLPSLALSTINVQYERAIYGKTSVGLGVRWMPKGSLPFNSALENVDDQLKSLELGNFAITPEIKFYMGKGVFKGFYIAPFLRYSNYNASINYEYESDGNTEVIPLTGKLNTFTAGVLFGAQWRLAKKLYFDWSIFGPQYGISNGKLTGKKALTAQEQSDLKESLDDIDLPVGKVKYDVNSTGAVVDLKGPWAGIRANFGIGYRF